MTLAESAEVVGALRRARRKQRVSAIHWVGALYQVYIVGLLAIVAVTLASGAIGDDRVSAATLVDVRAHGPAVLGTILALAVFMGLRSGSRGGPLALEQADVRHVLLSPVDRGVALRGPAWRQLRFLCFASAAVGATAGQLALRRLPGNPAEWMAVGALFGVAVVGVGFGSALVSAGTGLKAWLATLGGGLLVAWSVADVFDKAPTAPATFAGRLAIWPLRTDPLGLVGLAAALVLVAAGMRLVAGTSLEAAERRTALVGQLRFAVTLQDLRTVLVLRRQLAQEKPRSRPWIPAMRRSPRFVVWQRGLRSVARWPASRLVRVLVLAAVAGLAIRGAWSGTTPLVLLAGLALWVAALDAAEPLGQEIDHPGRTDAFPMERGELFLRHLPVVALVSIVTGLLAGVVALVPVGTHVPAAVALLVGAVAGLLAGCGAVVSVVQGAPEAVDMLAMSTPEIAGTRTVFRTVWPPGMAVLGTLPLLAARRRARRAGPASAQRRGQRGPAPARGGRAPGRVGPPPRRHPPVDQDRRGADVAHQGHRAPGRRARGRRGPRGRGAGRVEAHRPPGQGRRARSRQEADRQATAAGQAEAQARRARPRVPRWHQRQAHGAEEGPEPMSNDVPALRATGLTKTYDDLVALHPLDLTVGAGQSVALIGHNGSGKSTFLRMAAGLLDPTDGELEIHGFELSDVEARATTSFLPDDPVLYDDLSLREHAEYISRLHGGAGFDDYAESLCERLGLTERIDDLPSRFSRGLRQKTSIVLALVRPFSLLLVDEPFVGLDQPGKGVLLELLDEVAADGAATLVATHDPAYVDRVQRSIALRDGEVVFDGKASVDQVLGLVGG
ncbi:ABC transporter ATP-binding protein [Aquihabitans sp. G128]|uniref:ABC transporter ATP-binding protein n=1 Tax=Aquihabitans sp. G128 TaxID=2849779 RepID=UPI0020B25E8D|nr:ABC transporter ATP-binding protein [Aquihabitans sp. G128]